MYYYNLRNASILFRNQWREVGKPDAGKLSFKCNNLEEKKKYKFCVRAVNKIGKSSPAELQEAVLAKDPWGNYSFIFITIKILGYPSVHPP